MLNELQNDVSFYAFWLKNAYVRYSVLGMWQQVKIFIFMEVPNEQRYG